MKNSGLACLIYLNAAPPNYRAAFVSERAFTAEKMSISTETGPKWFSRGSAELGFRYFASDSGPIECLVYEKGEIVARVPAIQTPYQLRFDGIWLSYYHPVACEWVVIASFWNFSSVSRAFLPDLRIATLLARIESTCGLPSEAIECKRCNAFAVIRKNTLYSEFSTCMPCLKNKLFGLGDEWCGLVYEAHGDRIYYNLIVRDELRYYGPVHSTWAHFELENGQLYAREAPGKERFLVEKFWDIDGTRDTGFDNYKEAEQLAVIGKQVPFRCVFCRNYFHGSGNVHNKVCKRCVISDPTMAVNGTFACITCRKNPGAVAFLPCRHVALCVCCFAKDQATNCPLCSKTVMNAVKIAFY